MERNLDSETGVNPEEKTKLPRLAIRAEEGQIDWLWASLQVTSAVPLLHSDLLGDPFKSLTLTARNNGGNLELRAFYTLGTQLPNYILPVPERFLERYLRTRPVQPNETLQPGARIEEHGGRTIVIEPAYKITGDGTVLLPRDTKHPDEMAFSIGTVAIQEQEETEYGVAVTYGADGTRNMQLTTRSELESRVDQMHVLLANLTTSIWEAADRNHNDLTLEWQFPATISAQVRGQAFERYVSHPEIIGRLHRTKDFTLPWEGIGGLLTPKITLEGAIIDIVDPSLSQRVGTSPYGEKIFLISGAGETGKTSLIRASATRLQERLRGRGFTFYDFDCSSAIAGYGVFAGDALTSLINAAQDDVREGRTAFVFINKLDALLHFPLTGDTDQNRVERMQAVQRLRDIRGALKNVYDFHTRTANAFLTERDAKAKRIEQLRWYEQAHERGITQEEQVELERLDIKSRELREQFRQGEEQLMAEGRFRNKDRDRLHAKFSLPAAERDRLLELRYIVHGISIAEQKEIKRLTKELENPYFPTLVVVGESSVPRINLGILSDAFRREVKVSNETPDREDIFRTLIGGAQHTLERSGTPGVMFTDINFPELAKATERMPAGRIKEIHLQVMNRAKLRLLDTGETQTITTATYLECIQDERDSLTTSGQLNRPLGFQLPHTTY